MPAEQGNEEVGAPILAATRRNKRTIPCLWALLITLPEAAGHLVFIEREVDPCRPVLIMFCKEVFSPLFNCKTKTQPKHRALDPCGATELREETLLLDCEGPSAALSAGRELARFKERPAVRVPTVLVALALLCQPRCLNPTITIAVAVPASCHCRQDTTWTIVPLVPREVASVVIVSRAPSENEAEVVVDNTKTGNSPKPESSKRLSNTAAFLLPFRMPTKVRMK